MDPHTTQPSDDEQDARLGQLLSLLKREPTPEANFEERFLYNFKDRLAQELVRKPARSLLWEHIATFLGHRRAMTYGATSTVGALALAIVAWPSPSDGYDADMLASHEESFSLEQLAQDHTFNTPVTPSFSKRGGKHRFAFADYENSSTTIALTIPEAETDDKLPNLVSDHATLVPFHIGRSHGGASYSGYGAF